ncbi:MAG: glycosyltransferase family 4 protein [Vicinamibacterales bacterium]
MRLAWFSPMPPVRSGVAQCSAELVDELRSDWTIDVFVDTPSADGDLRSAHEFVWQHQQNPYDLPVYQLGNSSHHDYIWPYLFRFPGLVVLHDAHLHHARAALLLRERRPSDYRAEFAAAQPGVNPDAAELAVAGFDSHLLYQWPFTSLAVQVSRMTAVHGRITRDELSARYPSRAIEHVRLGHGIRLSNEEASASQERARARLGIPADAIVFGCFGSLTPDKRVPQVLDAFEAVLPYIPSARLLLAGPHAAHYDVNADVARRSIAGRVHLTGFVAADADLSAYIAAADITLNLRWPTARETSGPWLRSLAAGKPSIVIDLAHTADVPTLDPRTWRGSVAGSEAVAVAVDILDEDHSLRLAMRRLGQDAALRDSLGSAARSYWTREHSQAAMFTDYRRIVPLAAATEAPRPALPSHLRDDESGVMNDILETFGVPVPWSKI